MSIEKKKIYSPYEAATVHFLLSSIPIDHGFHVRAQQAR